MYVVINEAMLNMNHFPIVTISSDKDSILFAYEDEFNMPTEVFFDSPEAAKAAMEQIAVGISQEQHIIEITGGRFER